MPKQNAVQKLKEETYKSLLKALCPCCRAGMPVEISANGNYSHIIPGWVEKHPGGPSGFSCDAVDLRKLREEK
jgi:hypothetical protein